MGGKLIVFQMPWASSSNPFSVVQIIASTLWTWKPTWFKLGLSHRLCVYRSIMDGRLVNPLLHFKWNTAIESLPEESLPVLRCFSEKYNTKAGLTFETLQSTETTVYSDFIFYSFEDWSVEELILSERWQRTCPHKLLIRCTDGTRTVLIEQSKAERYLSNLTNKGHVVQTDYFEIYTCNSQQYLSKAQLLRYQNSESSLDIARGSWTRSVGKIKVSASSRVSWTASTLDGISCLQTWVNCLVAMD